MANAALDRLNAAELDELRSMRLSITQARRLLACRDQRGGFQSLDDLDRLAGFSRSSIQDLKDMLVGTMPSSPNWPAPTPASARPANEPAAARPQVTLRRRRRRRGGILFFVGFVCAATVILALVLAAAVGPPRISGACMIVLGVGIIVVSRDMAEVRARLDLIRSRSLQRVLVIATGAFLVAGGIARILA
jgi:Helix-hairpin-helix motif